MNHVGTAIKGVARMPKREFFVLLVMNRDHKVEYYRKYVSQSNIATISTKNEEAAFYNYSSKCLFSQNALIGLK